MLVQHKYAEGLRWADEALDLATQAGYRGAARARLRVGARLRLAANGRIGEAAQLAGRMASRLARRAIRLHGRDRALPATFLAARCAIRRCFDEVCSRQRARDSSTCLRAPVRACRPCANGRCAAEIHVAFVQQTHRHQQAVAACRCTVRIGRGPCGFERSAASALEVSDEPYRPSRKAQDKPLELLKLLVCCQAMRRNSADKQWLAQRLWPDADEANARKSLDMTLSRLRRLLGDDATIVASESRLAFSATHVWTDIAPLLDALSRVSEFRDRHAGGRAPHGAAPSADVAAMLEHFKGPFLPEDEGPSWLLAGREAVAAAVRSTLLIAESLFEGNNDSKFLAALERAFSADPTSEDLARALMRSLIRVRPARGGVACLSPAAGDAFCRARRGARARDRTVETTSSR